MEMVVRAGDVRVGDEIWNAPIRRAHFKQAGSWQRVVAVQVRGDEVRIAVQGWYTIKDRREGIGIRRWTPT